MFLSPDWLYRTASLHDHLCNQKMFDVLRMMYDVLRDVRCMMAEDRCVISLFHSHLVSYICASILSLILLHLRRDYYIVFRLYHLKELASVSSLSETC